MNKADIVDVLEDIAVLLELKGENPFKIRAYSTGARVLETMEADLGELIEAGQLSAVKGIGAALVEKIETLHATGELAYYTELRGSVAPGLIEMLEIPGLGGKKVKKLHDALAVESIDALQARLRVGRSGSAQRIWQKVCGEDFDRHRESCGLCEAAPLVDGSGSGAADSRRSACIASD